MSCDYCDRKTRSTRTELAGFSLCQACVSTLTTGKTYPERTRHVFVYLRVSTAQQDSDDRTGILVQKRQCLEYCLANGLDCVGMYRDVHSAFNMSSTGLKGFREMLNDLGFEVFTPHLCHAKNQRVQQLSSAIRAAKHLLLIKESDPVVPIAAIMVSNIDRFGRDIKNMLSVREQLREHGTSIISVTQNLDTATAHGDMNFRRYALEAEMFSREKSVKLKAVFETKRLLGHWVGGRARYGRRITQMNGVRSLVSEPSEAKVLAQIMTLNRERRSPSGIAIYLNSRKVTYRGKRWTTHTISYLIKREQRATEDVDMQ
jgi:DNA invertase Pin-like site-specific DNA recombinase